MFKNKIVRNTFIILSIVIVFFIAILAYANINKIDLSSFSFKEIITFKFLDTDRSVNGKVASSFKIDYSDNNSYTTYKKNIVSYGKDGIRYLDKNGKIVWSQSYTMLNPFAKSNKDCLVVGDIDGNNIYFMEDQKCLWNVSVEGTIVNIDINENNMVTVVRKTEGYKSIIDVYDKGGKVVLSFSRKDDFVIDAAVSDTEKSVILNCIDIYGVTAGAKIEVVNFKGETKFNTSFAEGLFAKVWYVNNNCIFAINDNTLVCYDKNGDIKWKESFDIVYSADLIDNKNIVIAVGQNEGEQVVSKVYTYTKDGRCKNEITIDEQVERVEATGKNAGIVCKRKIYFVNKKNYLLREYDNNSEFRNCYFFDERSLLLEYFNKLENVEI